MSKKHGGTAGGITTYCRYFNEQPAYLHRRSLCTGDQHYDPCPDFHICRAKPARKPTFIHVSDKLIAAYG